MLSPTYNRNPRTASIKPQTCNLLIFSDSRERMEHLTAVIKNRNLKITRTFSLEDAKEACRTSHDIAIVDCGPEMIEQLLKEIRSSPGLGRIPVLVSADRIASEESLAGVLPAYRAMPCSRDQLAWLVRQHLARIPSNEGQKNRFENKLL